MSAVTRAKELPYLDSHYVKIPYTESLSNRIALVALPFLALYSPFCHLIVLGEDFFRVGHSFCVLKDTKAHFSAYAECALSVAILAGTIFCYPLGVGISAFSDLAKELYALYLEINKDNQDTAKISKMAVDILHNVFFLMLIFSGSIELLTLSFLLQTILEGIRSHDEFKKGRILEGVAHMVMSSVRFFQGTPCAAKAFQKCNLPGKDSVNSFAGTAKQIRDVSASYLFRFARFLITPVLEAADLGFQMVSYCKDRQKSLNDKTIRVVQDVACEALLIVPVIAGLVLGQIVQFSAYLLAVSSFIHMKGDFVPCETEPAEKITFFQLNTCLPGCLALLFGGMVKTNAERVKALVQILKDSGVDVACLQEVSDLKDAYAIYEKMKPFYADFYFNMGASPFILVNPSGLMVFSKTPIDNPYFESFSNIPGTELMVNKGFFIGTTKGITFVNTHLSPSQNDLAPTAAEMQTRKKEQERICEVALRAFQATGKPVVVLLDANLQKDSAEYKDGPLFTGSIVSNPEISCETQYLVDRNYNHAKGSLQNLIIDYVLGLFGKVKLKSTTVPMFDPQKPDEAFSDHNGSIVEVSNSTVP